MSDWLDIAGRVYVVTGGSSGIGKAIVTELLSDGAYVANFDIHEADISNNNYLFVETDVTNRTSVDCAIRSTVARFGTIDGLVNNAGINLPRLLVDLAHPNGDYELTDGAFDKIFSINVKGAYIVAQGVARIMAVKGKGVIVNMSSEAGLEGSEGQSPYAASKAAINGFTRSWSKELARHQIRVIGVSPGIMEETGLRTLAYESSLAYTRGKTVEELRAGYSNTSATPLGRSGKLSEVADLVAYYLSDRASYITGITTNVAGGKSRG
ncbi:MAG: SDR family oxidoreductase [Lactococcus sp.]|nr:SDR family oxidoreductase [Lactococcus sp.]MDN5403373.1 SDR family oxidoreductase [Lactococcus sp.]MDN5410239.1 SDR family oxidoreductase [Lactococcus sp.]MDN5412130.1 SDR family oxidoreductase [Lactococcus sp.]MDN5436521.1 SDR family oxidoreductase [Lactococcus sp.]MDN5461905.1 SDR family oxidoreductase [Lactococcus sp.]